MGAFAEIDTFVSDLSASSLTNTIIDLSEADKNDPEAPDPDLESLILVRGEPGEGQANKYEVFYAGKDKVERLAARDENKIVGQLNEYLKLQAGFYMVRYEGSHEFVQIGERSIATLNLEKITFKIDEIHTYRVYKDFSNQEEQSKMLKIKFAENQKDTDLMRSIDQMRSFCARHRNLAYVYCGIYFSQDLDKFSKLIKFNGKSEYLFNAMGCAPRLCTTDYRNLGRQYITHTHTSKSGEAAISVLPGAYKIEISHIE